mmetsp:Transcript_6514/g.23385  ORF Transcript_6514/g.23385 Transcript_6514/m.23385 type:complete len:266 (-) Transcript_6514:426-1223(-)
MHADVTAKPILVDLLAVEVRPHVGHQVPNVVRDRNVKLERKRAALATKLFKVDGCQLIYLPKRAFIKRSAEEVGQIDAWETPPAPLEVDRRSGVTVLAHEDVGSLVVAVKETPPVLFQAAAGQDPAQGPSRLTQRLVEGKPKHAHVSQLGGRVSKPLNQTLPLLPDSSRGRVHRQLLARPLGDDHSLCVGPVPALRPNVKVLRGRSGEGLVKARQPPDGSPSLAAGHTAGRWAHLAQHLPVGDVSGILEEEEELPLDPELLAQPL